MPSPRVTPRSVPKVTPASPRQVGIREVSAPQLSLSFDADLRRDETLSAVYEVMRRAVGAFGGADALRAALNERESYIATISKALNRVDDNGQRKAPIDWLAPLLLDPGAAYELISGMCRLAGYEPPVEQREVDEQSVAGAALRLLRESPDWHRDGVRAQLARMLGVAPGRVPL